MKRSFRTKGFTLVECVVAIAVFAILSSMVMVIMSSAVKTAKKSSDTERQLNDLVENVEDSETRYKYYSGSEEIQMKFGGDTVNYSITYSMSNGYKDYISCPYPDCGYVGNFTDFLYKIPLSNQYNIIVTEHGGVNPYKVASYFYPHTDNDYWYPNESTDSLGNPVVLDGKGSRSGGGDQKNLNKFWCPECRRMLYYTQDISQNQYAARQFRCYACDNVGSPYFDKPTNSRGNRGFHYNRATCSFYCNDCGSAEVMEQYSVEHFGIASDMSINGIYPNAIRYDDVKKPNNSQATALITAWNSTRTAELPNNTTVYLRTTSSSPTTPTMYEMTLSYGSSGAEYDIQMPKGYEVTNITLVNRGSDTAAIWDDANSVLKIYKANASLKFTFNLVSTTSGNSFDQDYGNEGGLLNYWFRASESDGAGVTQFVVPRKPFPEETSS